MKWPWSVKTLDERSCEEVGTMLWIKGDNPPATPRLDRRNLLTFLNYLERGLMDRVYAGGKKAIGVSRESFIRFTTRRVLRKEGLSNR